MHNSLKSVFTAGALALALAVPAHAQLMLSGTSRGAFVDPGLTFTSVSNGPVVSLFSSGKPYRPKKPYNDTPTSITFTGQTFSHVADGTEVDLGSIKIKNGITLVGTTATWASMDVFLNVGSVTNFKLTSLLYSLDNTPNNGVKDIPDLYLVTRTAVNPLHVSGRTVNFDLKLSKPQFGTGLGATISEGKSASFDLLADVHFSPVPEPSTYAACGALLLVGLIALRRRQEQASLT